MNTIRQVPWRDIVTALMLFFTGMFLVIGMVGLTLYALSWVFP